MKVALLGTSLYSQGAEFVLATVSRGLASRGHDVDVVVSQLHSDFAIQHRDRKPFPIGLDAKMLVLKARRGRYSILELRRLFKRKRYDAVICHAYPFAIPTVLASLCLRPRPKIIYVEHLGGIGTDEKGNRVERSHSLLKILKDFCFRFFDAQFAVSQGTADAIHRMTGYPKHKVRLVYNPVIDESFLSKRSMAPTHPWLLSHSKIPVVVAAGAFCALKGYENLIKAIAKVNLHEECRLVIFGEGSLRPEYEKLIKELGIDDRVSLPGFTDRLPAEIKNASCFVVSSFVESFSIVLVEALACGVPVVSTDAPYGPREILQDGRWGSLVGLHDVDALASAIAKCITGGGVPVTAESVARFSVEAVAKSYEDELLMLGCR